MGLLNSQYFCLRIWTLLSISLSTRSQDLSTAVLFANAPCYNGTLIYMDSHHLNERGSRAYGVAAVSEFSADIHRVQREKRVSPMNYYQHPSAIVDDGAQIGQDSRIWHFVHVCAGARIGAGVSLGQNVFVGNKVIIGDHCKIQNNVSVYDNVTLEDGVFCGPSMVFTNVYNPRSLIERKNEYRDTLVRKGATLGANCTIVCGVTVGEYAFVGAGAVINRDVPSYALMVGVPARQIGWMSEFGEQLLLPLQGQAEVVCAHSGAKYVLSGKQVTKEIAQ